MLILDKNQISVQLFARESIIFKTIKKTRFLI